MKSRLEIGNDTLNLEFLTDDIGTSVEIILAERYGGNWYCDGMENENLYVYSCGDRIAHLTIISN